MSETGSTSTDSLNTVNLSPEGTSPLGSLFGVVFSSVMLPVYPILTQEFNQSDLSTGWHKNPLLVPFDRLAIATYHNDFLEVRVIDE